MQTTYIAMLSGGQDSTAMTLRLLELGEPVDYIVFADTGIEHKEMYEYIDKLDAFFQRKYGIKITRLHPPYTFDEYVWGIRSKGEYEGKRRGTPAVVDPCFWRRETKQYPFERWAREKGFKKIKKYIGYTTTEKHRAKKADEYDYICPLIEWGWNENKVNQYLKEMQMENKLYQHFSRTGCACCPKQSIDSKYMIYKHYPDVWEYMKETEKKLNEDELRTGIYPRWHYKYFIEDMEKIFKKKDRQPSLQFDFEPVQDCFCKI